jgi:hypothetical protein
MEINFPLVDENEFPPVEKNKFPPVDEVERVRLF